MQQQRDGVGAHKSSTEGTEEEEAYVCCCYLPCCLFRYLFFCSCWWKWRRWEGARRLRLAVGDDPAEAGECVVLFCLLVFRGFHVGGVVVVVVALEYDSEENLVRVRSGVGLEPGHVLFGGGEGAVGQVGECA